MYHASLTERSKREIYIRFSSRSSQLRCLVATIAFGMVWTCTKIEIKIVLNVQGVDIPDVTNGVGYL